MFWKKMVSDYDVIHETTTKTIDKLFSYLKDAKSIECYDYDLHNKNENKIVRNILFMTFNVVSYYNNVFIDMEESCEDKPIGLADLACDKLFLLSHVGNESNFVDYQILSLNNLDESFPDKEAFQIVLHTKKETIDGYARHAFIEAINENIEKYIVRKSFLDDYTIPE